MIVLVCGGREYANPELVMKVLMALPADSVVIQGGAQGADREARECAEILGLHSAQMDALWQRHGKAAGPLRNAAMLRLKPDKVIAFPGGRGTENCIKQAEETGIPVERVG